jgi:hypothetical protein
LLVGGGGWMLTLLLATRLLVNIEMTGYDDKRGTTLDDERLSIVRSITRQSFQQKVDEELVENARTDSNFVDKTKT